MNTRLAATVFSGAVILASFAPSDASTKATAWVYTNNTSDAYAWVTAYGYDNSKLGEARKDAKSVISSVTSKMGLGSVPADTIQGAWCVSPKSMDKHTLGTTTIDQVRIEVKGLHCAASTKDQLNKQVPFPGTDTKAGITTITGGYTKLGTSQSENLPGGGSEKSNAPGGPAVEYQFTNYAISTSTGNP
jgi:hypothetical protein